MSRRLALDKQGLEMHDARDASVYSALRRRVVSSSARLHHVAAVVLQPAARDLVVVPRLRAR